MHLQAAPIEYPDSDGQRMADNTLQFEWIVLLEGNLTTLYRDDPNVFIAGDLLWYPVNGEPETRQAPDVLVAFGRPKGYRGSYKQWEENDVPLTVVFEVLSPGNRRKEMEKKRLFYEEYGVEEYYVINPYRNTVDVYLRRGEVFLRQRLLKGFVSPRLGIRFVRRKQKLVVLLPNGEPFQTQIEITAQRDEAISERNDAMAEAANERQLRERMQERLARLRHLSRKARLQRATPAELTELEKLERDDSQ